MIPRNNILTLIAIAVLFFLLMIILCFSLVQSLQQNRSLKEQLEILETQIEANKQENLTKVDSLQKIIIKQDTRNSELKKEITEYRSARIINNRKSNEKKAAISRIHAVDSIYREISRHYR